LQDDICASGIRFEVIVLAVENKRDRVVWVERTNLGCGGRRCTQSVAPAIRSVEVRVAKVVTGSNLLVSGVPQE